MNTFVHKLLGWARVNRLRIAWGVAVGIVLAALGASVTVYSARSRHKQAGEIARAAPSLMAIGHIAVGDVSFWSLSASGRFLCTLARAGLLRLYETRAREIYRVPALAADMAVAAPSGRWVIAFARMDTEVPRVTFIGPGGKPVSSVSVNGAVWCADAASRGREDKFVVGTGGGNVYVFTNSGNGWHRRSFRTDGAVVSAGIDPQGLGLLVGCWQRSTISKIDIERGPAWQVDGDGQCLQEASLLPGGQRVFVQSRPNNPLKCGHYGMLDNGGRTLWTHPTCFTAAERFYPSANGDFVAVAYSRTIRNKEKALHERHCAIVNPNGEQLVDKGSLFSDIRPILMTDSGYAVVHNANRNLMCLGVTGDIKPLAQLPSRVIDARQSKDGSTVAVRCENGEVRSFRVVQ